MRSFCKLTRDAECVERSDLHVPLEGRVAAGAGSSQAHLQCKEYGPDISRAHHAGRQTHHVAITRVETVGETHAR